MSELQSLEPVRWGVLGASHFAKSATIPSMQRGQLTRIVGVASRSLDKARALAKEMGLAKAYDGYQALIDDPEIEAVYIPLPNHLHVSWAIKAAEAGKHVLCEKPISLNASEAAELLAVQRRTKVLCAEAYMVRYHPQWEKMTELLSAGKIGRLRAVQTAFSYTNTDPQNIRNQKDVGGGALYDIGGYAINTARLAFGSEPLRVTAACDLDEQSGCDRLTSAILDFGTGQASFVVGTQHVPYQRVHLFGTEGHLELEIPFNAPGDRPCKLWLDEGDIGAPNFTLAQTGPSRAQLIEVPTADHYTLQGDAFSRAIRTGQTPKNGMVEAVRNMRVIDALFRSAETQRWELVEPFAD